MSGGPGKPLGWEDSLEHQRKGRSAPVPEGPRRGKNRAVTTVGDSGAGRRLASSSRGGGRHESQLGLKREAGP